MTAIGQKRTAGSTAHITQQGIAMEITRKSFPTPLDLYRALVLVWSQDTASPTGAWSPENRAHNHCSLTALLVQDYFGGQILSTKTSGGTHFYNSVDGVKWDLTSSQFSEPIPYDDHQSSREIALADTSTEKYKLLVERLAA
jgi:hypothetical protein